MYVDSDVSYFDDDDEDSDGADDSKANKNGSRRNISASIQKQAEMWIVRKEPNGRLKWRILPLHVAIIFRAPYSVIEAILQSSPLSSSKKDDQGMLPLHLIMKNFYLQYNHSGISNTTVSSQSSNSLQQFVERLTNLWRTVEELLTAYPSGIFCRDRKGRTPLQIGLKTVKKSYHSYEMNKGDSSRNHTTKIIEQQQEMMHAALSVLQQCERIYTNTNTDRDNGNAQASQLHLPSNTVSIPTIQENTETQQKQMNVLMSIQHHHLETLQDLRTLFRQQHHEECTRYQQQHAIVQNQLNESLIRELQLQKEVESLRRHLQNPLQE